MTASRGISVVICCYNSASRLPETLRSIFTQDDLQDIAWEVLVVDNASTDETQNVARTLALENKKQQHLKITHEPRPGQTYARLRGIQESIYDLILFCDDDNHLDSRYLSRSIRMMEAQPRVGILGGWNQPKLPFYPGRWIEDCYTSLAIGKQSDGDKFTTWVFGAGMVVRRKVFEVLIERRIALMTSGRRGALQGAGDDAEICVLARFVGFSILYSNQLVLGHAISAHRLTKKFVIKANYGVIQPVIYLQVLEYLVADINHDGRALYRTYLLRVAGLIGSSFPRSLVGRHRFFNFIIFFQNTQIIFWPLSRRKEFVILVEQIKANLRGETPRYAGP